MKRSGSQLADGLLVIGAGGHAKVVIDLVQRTGRWRVIGVLDDGPAMIGRSVLGCDVVGGTSRLPEFAREGAAFIVAIGANDARQRLHTSAAAAGLKPVALVHPAATVAPSAAVGAGAVVMAGAVINADAVIGEGAIVNTGALIDHDCVIGEFSHVAPGVSLCGGVRVGARSLVGVGASALPGASIGADCVVGAGSVVLERIEDGARYAGVPARLLGKREQK